MAALTLGACGDDGTDDSGVPADAGDAGPMRMDGGTDAGMDAGPGDASPGDAGPGDAGPGDAGRPDASTASADGGASGDGSAEARLREVMTRFCGLLSTCLPEEFGEYFASVDECADYYASGVLEYFSDPACIDAIASYYDCYASVSCEALEDETYECEAEYAAIEALCPVDL